MHTQINVQINVKHESASGEAPPYLRTQARREKRGTETESERERDTERERQRLQQPNNFTARYMYVLFTFESTSLCPNIRLFRLSYGRRHRKPVTQRRSGSLVSRPRTEVRPYGHNHRDSPAASELAVVACDAKLGTATQLGLPGSERGISSTSNLPIWAVPGSAVKGMVAADVVTSFGSAAPA